MDDWTLEQFFDKFIANDSVRTQDEDLEQQVSPPDELLTVHDSTLDLSSQEAAASSTPWPSVSSIHPTISVPRSPEITLQIQNVVAMLRLGCRLDLHLIAHQAKNVEYRPKSFSAVTMRIREPRTTALLYQTGTVICTGAKSVAKARQATRRFARVVQRMGFSVCPHSFRILNLVGTCKIFPVALEKLAVCPESSYEPELFPALFYKVKPGITASIFSSGKLSIAGAKTEAEIIEAFDILYPVLSCMRRQ